MAITRLLCESTGGAVTRDESPNTKTGLKCVNGPHNGEAVDALSLQQSGDRPVPREWMRMIVGLSKAISSESRMKEAMATLAGAPDQFLRKHKIPGAPKGRVLTSVHLFKRFGTGAASGTSLKWVGRMAWDHGHYVCDFYLRSDGTYITICYCK